MKEFLLAAALSLVTITTAAAQASRTGCAPEPVRTCSQLTASCAQQCGPGNIGCVGQYCTPAQSRCLSTGKWEGRLHCFTIDDPRRRI